MSSPKPGTAVGTVSCLTRFPVKGMAGEQVEEMKVGWHGPEHDRGFAFLRLTDGGGLPFLSPRRCPELLSYRAVVTTDDVVVTGPSGSQRSVRDPELVAEVQEIAGEPLHLVQLWSHAADSMPLSLLTRASVASIGRLVGTALEAERFRPNLTIETPDDPRDHPEDRWVGRSLVVGPNDAVLHLARHTQRCTVVDYPILPDSGSVFGTIREHRRNRLGVYAGVIRPGLIACGDPLIVKH